MPADEKDYEAAMGPPSPGLMGPPAPFRTTQDQDNFYEGVRLEDRPVERSAVQPDDMLAGAGLAKGVLGYLRQRATRATPEAIKAAMEALSKHGEALAGQDLGRLSKPEILHHFNEPARRIEGIMAAPAKNARLGAREAAERGAKVKDAVQAARSELTPSPGVRAVSRDAATNPGVRPISGQVPVTPTINLAGQDIPAHPHAIQAIIDGLKKLK